MAATSTLPIVVALLMSTAVVFPSQLGATVYVERLGCAAPWPAFEESVLARLQNYVADRRGKNVFQLPWTSDAAPAIVRDPAICEAILATLNAGRRPEHRAHAVRVFSAGGLYWAHPAPGETIGEFDVEWVLNGEFKVVQGFAG